METALQGKTRSPAEGHDAEPMFDLIELLFFAYRDFIADPGVELCVLGATGAEPPPRGVRQWRETCGQPHHGNGEQPRERLGIDKEGVADPVKSRGEIAEAEPPAAESCRWNSAEATSACAGR